MYWAEQLADAIRQPKPPRLRFPDRGRLLCHRLGLAYRRFLNGLGRNLGATAASALADLRLGVCRGRVRLQHSMSDAYGAGATATAQGSQRSLVTIALPLIFKGTDAVQVGVLAQVAVQV